MPKQRTPLEVNRFTAGLATDANILDFPQNASFEEDNMVLDSNGDRRRRLGMDYEKDAVFTFGTTAADNNTRVKTYEWKNAGGVPDTTILVVATDLELDFFDTTTEPISANYFHRYKLPDSVLAGQASFSSIDGVLVVVNGDESIYKFQYTDDPTPTITTTTDRILVRDLWGVEDIDGSRNLREGANVTYRPTSLTQAHLYNLRNQTWGVPRVTNRNNDVLDSLVGFYTDSVYNGAGGATRLFPSNADSVNYAYYPLATGDSAEGNIKRFFYEDLYRNPLGAQEASRGYFIIDALQRGTSRVAADVENVLKHPELDTYEVTTLPADTTTGGATVTSQFAGRTWFGGFTGETTDGDSKSPQLESYVFFSRLVRDVSDIGTCYQEADPTSAEDSAIVATDGGFIRVDGAYGIQQLIPAGDSLIILAENGVWRILGGNNSGFTALDYRVERLSDNGCINRESVIYSSGRVYYWGSDAIFVAGVNEVGEWSVESLTRDRIDIRYNAINDFQKKAAQGIYDPYDKKIRWIYNVPIETVRHVIELVFDTTTNAFYTNTIRSIDNSMPRVVALAKGPTYYEREESLYGLRSVFYVVWERYDPFIKYTFARYNNTDYQDWRTFDGIGKDATAYIETGPFATGDNQRRKKLPKLTMHLKRTETGFNVTNTGNWSPKNPSSCMVQAKWEWSNSNRGNRWSKEREFYRYNRHYFPSGADDEYDIGQETIITSDVIRGHGKSLSLRFTSSPKKDMHIYGWSMLWDVGKDDGT